MQPAPAARRQIPAAERCIVALDFPSAAAALQLVERLGDDGVFYKVGLELFAAGDGRALIDELLRRGKKVFADFKLFDVPQTVAGACAQLANSGAHFVTVHGNDAIVEAAVKNAGNMGVLAVTALTSLDQGDLADLGFEANARALVLSRARRAMALGCAGVVSSGLEVRALREECGNGLALVTPGVRPLANREEDDQKRIATPTQIIADGGDYLVVGRPIKNAADPRAALQAITKEIAAAGAYLG